MCPRRSAPSLRSTGPAAGAGQRARQGATGSSADDRSPTARKAGSAGCRRAGPAGGCPAGITWSGCRQCPPCWRCQTTAGSCRAGCGPDGRSCAGWSRGSGSLARSPGVGCSPWGSVKEDADSPGLPTQPWVARSAGAHTVICRTAGRCHTASEGHPKLRRVFQPEGPLPCQTSKGGTRCKRTFWRGLGHRDTWTKAGGWGLQAGATDLLGEHALPVHSHAQPLERQGPVTGTRRPAGSGATLLPPVYSPVTWLNRCLPRFIPGALTERQGPRPPSGSLLASLFPVPARRGLKRREQGRNIALGHRPQEREV